MENSNENNRDFNNFTNENSDNFNDDIKIKRNNNENFNKNNNENKYIANINSDNCKGIFIGSDYDDYFVKIFNTFLMINEIIIMEIIVIIM